jgi:hypothetical protein
MASDKLNTVRDELAAHRPYEPQDCAGKGVVNRRDLEPVAFVIRKNNGNPLEKVCVHPMGPSEVNRATVSWLKEG